MGRVVLLASGLACAWAAAAGAAGAARAPERGAGTQASAPSRPPSIPPGLIPSGCEPAAVRVRLGSATDAEVSRACGNISHPWAYRGRAGRRLALRDFGRHRPGPEWTKAVADLLVDAPVDTAYRVPTVNSDCNASTGLPIYLLRFEGPDRPTFAVVRFDLAVVQLFDSELPLGMIELGERADSLWILFAQVLGDDPLLRRPRPAVATGPTAERLHGDDVWVEALPEALERVPPVYPDDARRTNTEGTVWVRARIGTDGAVRDAFVIAGPAALRDASLEALWQWRFKPAAIGGVPTAVWVMVPVKFSLR